MEKLRFEFVVKASEDPKSNIICITSIMDSNRSAFSIPEQLQPAKLHDAAIKTQAFQKLRITLQKRHDRRQIWISVTPEIGDGYLDEDGNMQTSTAGISEETLTTILENFTEIMKDKYKHDNIRKLTKKFVIDKFTRKTSNVTQWMNIFETECTRLGIEEDTKKIEALRLFLEDACLDWYSSMLIKYTVNSEWSTWKQNFCETYADKGWSPIRMWLSRVVCVLCVWFVAASAQWRCPGLSARPAAECSCDLPHTLRCAGDHTALQIIGRHLREQKARNKNTAVSLLDCALRGVSVLSSASVAELAGVGLHGLVISSGDIRRVQQGAFSSVSSTLFALGLPNNQLPTIPTEALTRLWNLDRLDLSNNRIWMLDSNSFKGINNLTYLDISDNQLTDIAADTFKPLVKLTVLRLRGNLLKVPALGSLKEAHMLRDLDLSSNALEGPLGASTVPPLSCLVTLHLSDNTFASIRRGALAGLTNLTHLNLHNNQIDVLEDYAFKHLANLTHLDLSHNEIVAVSGASLAQLTNLVHLDLSHNFLRSLSAEPLKSLRRLTELLLHDNDISMIDDGALALHKDLGRFTIEDNPLNCDCLMAGFARWLREAKNLLQTDKSAAVCATPPHLEGALLSRLSKNKLCDDFEHTDLKQKDTNYDFNKVLANSIVNDYKFEGNDHDVYVDKQEGLDDDLYDEELEVPGEEDLPISKSELRLLDAWYDDEEVHLSWAVDPPSTNRYRCTGVTASRAGGLPKHVACHRAAPANVVIRGLKIDPADQYTFCIALEEMDTSDVPLSLVLGCGTPQLVRQRATFATVVPIVVTRAPEPNHLRVTEVRSNVTSEGVLTVLISVIGLPQRPQYTLPRSQRLSNNDVRPLNNCYVVLAVLSHGSLVAQKDTPCQSTLEISMEGFIRGPYEVCAAISKQKIDDTRTICVVPQVIESLGTLEMKASFKSLNTALIGVALGLMVIVVGLVWFVRKMLKKPTEFETHRCFRQEPVPEENPRASYVMLTATSKV